MTYTDFTLESAVRLLAVVTRASDLIPDAPTAWLGETLARGGQGIHLSLISEFVVAPILLAARELTGNRFAIFSGQRLDVDPARGLTGECDFLLAASEPVLPLRAPIAAIVEAKKNDIENGLGQCVAQMVAADQFNRDSGGPARPVFGSVTTGEAWQFLRLDGADVILDRRRYYIDNPSAILGAIRAMIAESRGEG